MLDTITKNYNVIETVTFGNGQTTIFESQNKQFALVEDAEKTLYNVYRDTHDWVFLPGCKKVKTIKSVEKFVIARTK